MAAISHSYMLEVLELDNCSLLTSMSLDLPRLQNIRLVHCRKFADLNLRSTMLSSIMVSNCPSLHRINITSNSLQKLALQKQENLTTLALQCQCLQEVDLTDCESLTNSICQVFSDGGGCPMLKSLVLDNCEVALRSLNLGICPKLNVLNIEAPHMVSLELKGCGVLSEASIDCPPLFMSLGDWQDSSSSSQSQPSPDTDAYLVGFIIANIVGIHHYSGTITGRELVGLIGEPLNHYDQNAIKVFNTRSLQVGHIEKSVASVLSPLIDSRKVNVEGIVLNSRSAGNKFKIPCQIHIFAKFQDFDFVKSVIMRGGLLLISETNASFGLSEAVVVKEKNNKGRLKNLDEIFKLVDENVSKKGELGTLEPPNELIIPELFLHQKEGLWWLMHRENSIQI